MQNNENSKQLPPNILKIAILAAALVFFILLRWNSINMPFETDEGEYAYSAKVLLEGGLPYRDSFMQKPPMIIYIYAIARLTAPPPAVWAPRLLAMIFVIGASSLTGWIAYKEFGKKIGIIALWLIIPMMAFPPLFPFAANTEVFMLFPLMAAISIYIWKKETAKFNDFFLAGFTATVALLFKPISLLLTVFLFGYWLLEIWKKTNNYRLVIKFFSAATLGFLTAIILFLGYFIIKDGGKTFWEIVIKYNGFYVNQYGYSTDSLLYALLILISYWPFLFIILVWALPKCNNKNLKFHAILLAISVFSIYNLFFYHYYLFIMPFLAIISAVALSYADDQLYEYVKNKSFFENFKSLKKLFPTGMLTVSFVIFTMILPFSKQFELSSENLSAWIYSYPNAMIESPLAAQKLAEITKPSDKVFIAGSEPQILYYADRFGSSRFITTYSLSYLDTPLKKSYQEQAIDEIRKNPPAAILIPRCNADYFQDTKGPNLLAKYINDLVYSKYTLAGGFIKNESCSQINEFSMENDRYNYMGKALTFKKNYDNTLGYWQEPIDLKNIEKASLLLFKKN